MNLSPASWRRQLAVALVCHAARVMPESLARWAEAMRNELVSVGDDREALRWAMGCVSVAHRTRLSHLWLLDVAAIRVAGVLLVLFRAFDVTLPSVMTAAYRLRASGLQEGLGQMTPGDDFQRLIPLMEAIPGWLHVLLLTAGACYLIAGLWILARRRVASLMLLAAVVTEVFSQVLSRPVLAPAGVVVTPSPSVLASVLLPIVFPLLLAVAACSGSRRDSERLHV